MSTQTVTKIVEAGDLDQNWPLVPLTEVAEINPRTNKSEIPDDLEVSFVPMPAVGAGDGSIDVSQLRPAGEVKKGYTAFVEGDVLFAKITPCMENGKMAIVPELINGYGFGSTEFHVLRPKANVIAEYLYYYVASRRFRGVSERHMTGAVGQRRVPAPYLKKCTIPLAPLDRQREIVTEIEKQFSRLDEAVTNLHRVKANLKRYKAAVLKAAVEGRLVETEAELACREDRTYETGEQLLQRILETRRSEWKGRGKYKEPVALDTTDLPKLPEGWVWAISDVIFDFVTSGSRGWAKYYSNQGSIFLRVGNLDHGTIDLDLSHIQRVKAPTNPEADRSRVRPGDLLISITAELGMVAVVPEGIGDAYINQHVAIARCTDFVDKIYIGWYFAYEQAGKRQLELLRRGATKAGLGLDDIRSVHIPLPPANEQGRIVTEVERRLSLIRKLEAQADSNLERADHLRNAVLARAFTGDRTLEERQS